MAELSAAPGVCAPPDASTPSRLFLRRFARNRAAFLALLFLLLLIALAALAPGLSPYPYAELYQGAEHKPPGWTGPCACEEPPQARDRTFLLGTDTLGRDSFARLLQGARISLLVGALATLLSLALGTLIGLTSGFYGGWTEAILMRFTDTVFAFPSVLLAVAITAVFNNPSKYIVLLALGLVGWTGIARLVRSQVLTVRTLDYITAARALGASDRRILLLHVLPNCLGPIIVAGTLSVGGNILGEAGLSFLGLGVQEPETSWGAMLAHARQHYQE